MSKLNNWLYRWLLIVATLHVIGGVALAFEMPEFIWQAYQQDLYRVFSINNNPPENVKNLVNMIIRLFGPTVASWGLLMIYLLRRIFLQRDEVALLFLISALLIWFLLDTSISLSFGVMSHFWINGLAFVVILLPLLVFKLKGNKVA